MSDAEARDELAARAGVGDNEAWEDEPEAVELFPLEDEPTWVNICYYGEGGTGKTTDLAHLAKVGSVVYVNAESGIKRQPLQRLDVPISNIQLFRDVSFDSLENLFWVLKGQLEDDGGPVGCCWDSMTEIQPRLVRDQVDTRVEAGERKGVEVDRFHTTREDWNHNAQEMSLLIRAFRDLPFHWGIAALERRDVDDDDGSVKYGPSVSPALQGMVQGYFDIVCHTTLELVNGEETFFGEFSPAGKYFGKDRFGMLPRRLPNPTFDRIIAYIEGDLTEDTDDVLQRARERRRVELQRKAELEQAKSENKTTTRKGRNRGQAE